MCRQQEGFTLIELLVVIAIIAVLAAILFPVFESAERSAQTSCCLSNEQQIGLAYRAYMNDNNYRFMPAAYYDYLGSNWTHNSYVYILSQYKYVTTQAVFMCPTAPHDPQHVWQPDKIMSTPDKLNPNAPDITWTWDEGTVPIQSHGNYGLNVFLGGMDYNAIVQNGWSSDVWADHVPQENEVHTPSKTILLTDARWVDLGGGYQPGRIGLASERHFGQSNVLCCDFHVRLVPAKYLLTVPLPPNSTVHWSFNE